MVSAVISLMTAARPGEKEQSSISRLPLVENHRATAVPPIVMLSRTHRTDALSQPLLLVLLRSVWLLNASAEFTRRARCYRHFCIRSDTRLHSIIAAGGSSAHGVHLAGVFDDLGYDLQCRLAV